MLWSRWFWVFLAVCATESSLQEDIGEETQMHDDRPSREGRRRSIRAATARAKDLWLNNTIPYIVGPLFTNATRMLILRAMGTWEKYTCIRFVPRTNEKDYIVFRVKAGCSANVGRIGGRQFVNLDRRCHYRATVLHELGHVIGFWHEQSRPDRDDYVEVLFQNIVPGEKHNFVKHSTNTINSLDQIFDYQSIMLYGTVAFSTNARRTLRVKVTRYVWEQLGGIDYFQLHTESGAWRLSNNDVLQTNLLYRCPFVFENGEVIVNAGGKLISPNYPKPYPRSRDLVWIILPRRMRKSSFVALVFEDFSVGSAENDGSCKGDYLEIRKGKGGLAPWLVNLCGTRSPFVISVFHDGLYIKLHSTNESVVMPTTKPTLAPVLDEYSIWHRRPEKKKVQTFGFMLRYRISECRHVLTNLSGMIHSPSYPSYYPADTDCIWLISVPTGYRIAISFEDFDFKTDVDECNLHEDEEKKLCQQACLNEPGGYTCGCYWGYATVRDKDPNRLTCVDIDECEIGNGGCSHNCTNTHGSFFCSCPPGYYLDKDDRTCKDSDECKLSLCSQTCVNTPGSYHCSCKYGYLLDSDATSCILAIPMCTGVLTVPVGRLTSPAIPTWYRGLVECEWTIRVRQRYTIGAYLSLSWSRDRKCQNFIKIHTDEGLGMRSLLFCGREDIERWELLHFKAHEIRVYYHVQAPYPGKFTLRYHMRPKKEDLCGGVLNSPDGVIQSPGYPSKYPSRALCRWKIKIPREKRVVLLFDDFRLERQSHCKYDYVDIQVREKKNKKLRPIGRFCGRTQPPVISAQEGELVMTFRSDGTVQKKGFRSVYTIKSQM